MEMKINLYKKYDQRDSVKYVFLLMDNSLVEVAKFYHNGVLHVCISTQVGCPVGCRHCATTYASIQYKRNLTSDEMIAMVKAILENTDERHTKVLSFSGHGEPFLNWNAVCEVIEAFKGSFEDFYITTIGNRIVFEEILKSKETRIVFYLSLHGTTDEERSFIIPGYKGCANIDELIKFSKNYSELGGNIVLNYMLHKNNSSMDSLRNLCDILRGCNEKVCVRFTDYNTFGQDTGIVGISVKERKSILLKLGQVRNECDSWKCRISKLEGQDVGIACGQLRANCILE